MPCRLLNPTFASGQLDQQFQATLPRGYADDTHIWTDRWNWERRGPEATVNRNPWTSCWPRSQFGSGDPATPMGVLGQCYESGGNSFETPHAGYGTQSIKFILGTCVDNLDAPVANAIVQCFATTTDLLTGEVTANTDGTYAVPTPYVSPAQHYLVAYKAGSPDIAGTTVNTLTATNIDGT